jgi:hypothetical protein
MKLPLALRRIHERLQDEVELLKLHIKHYHMNVSQFRRRTNALKLPEDIYEKFAKIVKRCEACTEATKAPTRSRVSGLRAQNFGDLIFVDHAELAVEDHRYLVLLVLDASSNLLWARAQNTKEDEETLENLRMWMDHHQCCPKALCSDMAFNTPPFQRFYAFHKIRPIPTGPRTPWPNRAESAVRLFKKQFAIMVRLTSDPTLTAPTCQQMVVKCCWARNNQPMLSGKTPLEVAYGRKPPPMFNPETATPEQLSVEPLEQDANHMRWQKIAMQAHLEATQLVDLRNDLARNLRPSDGPFKPGDRVYFWNKDHSKLKAIGCWERGRVLSHTGSMVLIETLRTVYRVNQSKVKLDHDPWHDVPDPLAEPSAQPEQKKPVPVINRRMRGKQPAKKPGTTEEDTIVPDPPVEPEAEHEAY